MTIADYCINPDCREIIRYEKGTEGIRCPYCNCSFLALEFKGEKQKVERAIAAGKRARVALELTRKEMAALQELLNKSNRAWVENVRIQAYIAEHIAGVKADTADIKSGVAGVKADAADIKSGVAGVKEDTAGIRADTGKILSGQRDITKTLQDIKSKQEKFAARYAETLERAFATLEVEAFDEARDIFESVLKIAPKEPQAYLGKLMADMRVIQRSDLANCKKSFQNNVNYKLLMKFGDQAIQEELKAYNEQILRAAKAAQEKKNAQKKPVPAQQKTVVAKEKDAGKKNGWLIAATAATAVLAPSLAPVVYMTGKTLIQKDKEAPQPDTSADAVVEKLFQKESGSPSYNVHGKDWRRRISVYLNETIALTVNGELRSTAEKGITGYSKYDWKRVKQIAGSCFCCVGLMEDGTVISTQPRTMSYLKTWKNIQEVAVCANDVIGIKGDGSLIIQNSFLPSERGPLLGNREEKLQWTGISSVAGSDFAESVGCKKDGTVVAAGIGFLAARRLSGWSGIKAVSCAQTHVLGLTKDGHVQAVKLTKDDGQCDVQAWNNIIAIEAGNGFSIGLKKDGTVVAAGRNNEGQCNVSSWRNIVAIAAGHEHVIGVRADGSFVAAGRNDKGQCDVSAWNLLE